ncbi:kinase-like domain-containing protein [Boeremia exigua]|uniref:kinase-like domain-containing protein n=1 Tax=Boeremia exigua TaxID=749465 RepID=UPI001E8CC40C|nr:kinase-like domain-containing protein [Boeremia exigua]KAH6629571.1 kinase-like domain-containing protein [Boeremia exigua]
MGSARRVAEESIDHLIPRPPYDNLQYFDEKSLNLIRKHLKRHDFFRPWWDSPRLYALLRMLRCDEDAILRFQNHNINDFWLPVDEDTFSSIRTNVDWDEFRRMQLYVLSDHDLMSEAELLETPNVHRHLEYGEDFFEEGRTLGEGTSARVFQVQHVSLDNRQGSFYACKRAIRGKGRLQGDRVQLFIKELHILRRIQHPHTLRLVASYTDYSNFALILSPVADESLKEMLENAVVPLSSDEYILLRQSFACLVSALSYLHKEFIRHKDIKPSNIVLSKGRVYLCDFGVSNDWTGSDPTTEGPSHLTPGYCAPEVLNYEQRNDASDVWSMGRVFCEIFTVAAGRPLRNLLERIGGDLHGIYRAEGLGAMDDWISELRLEEAETPTIFLRHVIRRMMANEPAQRPKARQLLTEFSTQWPYVNECCQEAYGRKKTPMAPILPSLPSLSQRVFRTVSSSTTTNATPQQPTTPLISAPADSLMSPHRLASRDNVDTTSASGLGLSLFPDRRPTITDCSTSAGSPELKQVDTWSSGSATSRHTPRTSSVGQNDRRLSYGASSIQSPQLVRWSSGLVLPPKPQSVNNTITCNCAARQKSPRLREHLVLSVTGVEVSNQINQPTIEFNPSCDLRQNTLHVYESYSRQSTDAYRIWLKTRRLVVSQMSGSASKQCCSSFWLPLTDISSAIERNHLTLRWSDCNQWKAQPPRNNKQSYDCIYDPDNLNNEITISFVDNEAALAFLHNLSVVYNDVNGVQQWRSVEIIDQQRLLAVEVREQNTLAYRIACVATYDTLSHSHLQLFIHWPDIDLDIRIEFNPMSAQRSMIVRFAQVSTPNYISSVTSEPWIDESKVAEWAASNLVLSTYCLVFPFDPSSPLRLPQGVKQTLQYLTGWNLCFFAPNVHLAKQALLRPTPYGFADVLLWTRGRNSENETRMDVTITFRLRHPGSSYLWRSASVDITSSLKQSFTLTTAALLVSHKTHGDALHTPSMTAVDATTSGLKTTGKSATESKSASKRTGLALRFADSGDLRAFVGVLAGLQRGGGAEQEVHGEGRVRQGSAMTGSEGQRVSSMVARVEKEGDVL